MFRSIISFCILVVISITISYAQDASFRLIHYAKDDGLHSNQVKDFVNDDFGYLWIATDQGLERFDGSDFELFEGNKNSLMELKSNDYISLYKDSNGLIWAGTNGNGITVINPNTYEVKNYEFKNEDSKIFHSGKITDFFEDSQQRLWAIDHGLGLARFNPTDSNFTIVKPYTNEIELKKHNSFQLNLKSPVQDIDIPEIFWIASGYGLCRFNTKTTESQYFFPPQTVSGKNPYFLDLMIDYNGDVWLASWASGLYKFDRKSKSFCNYSCIDSSDIEPYSSCLNTQGITALNKNEILINTKLKGFLIFNKTTEGFHRPHISLNSVEESIVLSKTYIDKANNIWIATGEGGKGFYCFKKRNHIKKVPLPGYIKKVISHPNLPEIYAISHEGIFFRMDTNYKLLSQHKISKPLRPYYNNFMDIALDTSMNIWVLGSNNLYKWNPNIQKLDPIIWPEWVEKRDQFGYYWNLLFDNNNTLWISSQSGGFGELNISNQTVRIHNFEQGNNNSLIHNYSVGRLYLDSLNNVWACGKGVFYYSNEKKHFINYPRQIITPDGETSLSNYASFISLPSHKMWLSFTLDKIAIIDINDSYEKPIETISLPGNLPSYLVEANIMDQDGNIWLSSDIGLTKVYPKSNKVEHYGEAYGLHSLVYLTLNKNGDIIMGTNNGFYHFHPDSLQFRKYSPKPAITNFNIFDKAYKNGINPSLLKEVKLSYKQNFFSFKFSALDFESKAKKQFSYMLEGLDKDWIFVNERNYVAYTNIGAGEYTFKLRAKNPDGNWGSEIAQIKIKITPPFWETIWFWTLITLVVIAVIFLIYKFNIDRIREEEKLKTAFNKQLAEVEMKALRAQMNPHFLFNSLNAIKLYVLRRDKEKAADYLTDFAKLIRLILKNSSEEKISLQEEIEALELYISIEKMRFDEGFEYKIDIDKQLNPEEYFVPPLLFQPYTENAIWHGLMHKKKGIGQLSLNFVKLKNGFECIIQDNGIGRKLATEVKSKSAQKNKSLGMKITKNRMEIDSLQSDFQYDVNIVDLYDNKGEASGTKVVINILNKTT